MGNSLDGRTVQRTIWPINLDTEKTDSKRHMYLSVHRSTIYNSQDMERTYMYISRWMDKDVVHIYNGMSLSYKKWMKLGHL